MPNDLPTAYPLQWPLSRPRATSREEAAFRQAGQGHLPRRPHTIMEGVSMVLGELQMMDASEAVISSNLRVRLDGLPYSDQRAPADPGVAVYFRRGGQNICFACDKWGRVEDNLWAIFLTLEAMRGVDRWGAANLQASFTGYLAIAAPAPIDWRKVLGVGLYATLDNAKGAYRELAKTYHPDAGGSHEEWLKIQTAYQAALKELGPVPA